MQADLLSSRENLDLPGGGALSIYKSWLSRQESSRLFEWFLSDTPWEQPDITVAGRSLPIPRLQAWYGHDNADFTYSGTRFRPRPFSDELNKLAKSIGELAGSEFNSVLINQYRHEQDSVGWHADDEPEFGLKPIIASLSLGETRRFCFKPKKHHLSSANWRKGQRSIAVHLEAGDLVVMNEEVQCLWQHSVPKESQACSARINLTFRKVCKAKV